MASSMCNRLRRRAALGVVFGLMALLVGVTPTLAATTTPFSAIFKETTTQRNCPPGTPPTGFCFTGSGTGPVVPPGDPNGRETFAGFVDFNVRNALGCPIDHNVVSIRTFSGTLFLTTTGALCGVTDNGTWSAFGGTGIFAGARGSGTVSTTGGAAASVSTYTGTLTLRGGNGD